MSSELASVAKAMVAPGKGILAADESTSTANKRFAAINLPQTEEMRQKYRDMLLTTPDFGEYISGVILYDETIRQNARSGKSFVEVLQAAGSLPGIKLDTGPHQLALALPDEKITEGLDGLAKRVDEYVKLGAKFAKWRAVITVDVARGLPSDACLHANAHALARYAAICQAGGLVPIVEPEVVMDGGATQTLEQSFAIHERTLRHTFEELAAQNVVFENMVLKPSMVIPGQKSGTTASVHDVAEQTLTALLRWVPAAVAGIAGAILIDAFQFATQVYAGATPAEVIERTYTMVASVLLGPAAYANPAAPAIGALLHFLVSIGWACGYVYLARSRTQLLSQPWLSGAAFGLVVYVFMQVVLLAGGVYHRPATPAALGIALVAHVAFFGIPVALVASQLLRRPARA